MVNTHERAPSDRLASISVLVRLYVVVAMGTVPVLGVLSAVAPRQAPRDAWVHAVVVAVFAVVLWVRLRSARAGTAAGLRAVGLIASALCLVNVVEAALPGFAPGWMRIEMVGIAVLMATVIGLVIRERP